MSDRDIVVTGDAYAQLDALAVSIGADPYPL